MNIRPATEQEARTAYALAALDQLPESEDRAANAAWEVANNIDGQDVYVREDYITGGPGYAGPVWLIHWDGDPNYITVITHGVYGYRLQSYQPEIRTPSATYTQAQVEAVLAASADDYSDMTDEDFNRLLTEVIDERPASHLLSVDGVGEILREEYNNEVLDRWQQTRRATMNALAGGHRPYASPDEG